MYSKEQRRESSNQRFPGKPPRQSVDQPRGHDVQQDRRRMPGHWTQAEQRVVNSEPQNIQGAVVIPGRKGIEWQPNVAAEIFWNPAPNKPEPMLHALQMTAENQSK